MPRNIDDLLGQSDVALDSLRKLRDHLIAKHGREDALARLTLHFAELASKDLTGAIGLGGIIATLLLHDLEQHKPEPKP